MLAPVANHQAEAHDGQRQQEHKDGRPPVELPHGVLQGVAAELPEGRLEREHRPVLPEEVEGKLEPDEEVEAPDVVQEVPEAVALVPDGGAQVVRAVALDVVVLDVVVEVRVPGVAHEGVQQVGEGEVEPGVGLVEDAAAVDVLVHHQRVGAGVGDLHDGVHDAVDPGEVVEEPQGRRHRGGEVQDHVGEHDDVRLDAHDGLAQLDVGLEQPVQHGRQLAQRAQVPGVEDGGLEVGAIWVVHARHDAQGRLITGGLLLAGHRHGILWVVGRACE